ncbi:MAG: hypothetical protein ACTHU0_20680 [Kofleriaceae bacterium]
MRKLSAAAAAVVVGLAGPALVGGCGGAPKTVQEQQSLVQRANATLNEMFAKNPGLRDVVAASYGYAVFPSVGKGGVVVGGAYGRGILYEQGRPTGFVELKQGSLGAQLGGASFSELVILRSPHEVADLKAGRFNVGANATAVLVTAGAAGAARTGATVFVMPRGGLMVDVSVAGQTLGYQPFAG